MGTGVPPSVDELSRACWSGQHANGRSGTIGLAAVLDHKDPYAQGPSWEAVAGTTRHKENSIPEHNLKRSGFRPRKHPC